MKILPERSILDNKYKTVIRPLEMGDSIRTAQQEIDMLADTPQILRYSDIEFKGSLLYLMEIQFLVKMRTQL